MRLSKMLLLAGGVGVLGAPMATLADPALDLARKFGARESIQSISLSPDGTKLAVIVPMADGERLAVVDLAGDATLKPILSASGDNDRLAYCRWATDARMICGAYYRQETEVGQVGYSRLFAVSADGRDVQVLSQESGSRALYAMTFGGGVIDWVAEGKPGRVLMERQWVPENSTGTHISSSKEGLGVEAVDVTTLKRSPVESPRGDASEYIADGQGIVRVMGMSPTDDRGYSKGVVNYLYRRQGSRDWEKLSQLKLEAQTESGFNPYAVDSRNNLVYGFDDAAGFKALYSMTLDGNATRNLLLARNDVDVDGLIRIGRSRRVVGASYATERRTSEFFDPELKRLRGMLAKAIPHHPIVEFVDACAGWAPFLDNMRRVMPEGRFVDMDTSHPIFHSFFEIATLGNFPQAYNAGAPVFRGLFEDNDPKKRLQMIVNYNTDISQYWEWSGRGLRPFDETNEAYKLGVNYIIYGMTH